MNNIDYHDGFYLDSGATHHVCNNRDYFVDFTPCEEELYGFEGTSSPICGRGTVLIPGTKFKLKNAVYMPNAVTNLVSIFDAVTLFGCRLIFKKSGVYLKGRLLATIDPATRLFRVCVPEKFFAVLSRQIQSFGTNG